jgi:hypothetical protein
LGDKRDRDKDGKIGGDASLLEACFQLPHVEKLKFELPKAFCKKDSK